MKIRSRKGPLILSKEKWYNDLLVALTSGNEDPYEDYIRAFFKQCKEKYNPPLKSQLFCCKRHKQRGDDFFR
jgi:hypothetical protein